MFENKLYLLPNEKHMLVKVCIYTILFFLMNKRMPNVTVCIFLQIGYSSNEEGSPT
jgi:hypothetical protein